MVQMASPRDESAQERRRRVAGLVAQAHEADLVVLPELRAADYFEFEQYEQRAETFDGPTVRAGQEWARELRSHIHLGSIVERDANGRLFNTAVLISPDGAIAQRYRKMHIFGYASGETELPTPGNSVEVVDTVLGRLATTTRYDLRFPDLWSRLAKAGAQTALVPAAWPLARIEHWRLFTTCRAVEKQVLLIACNAVGEQAGGIETGGHSRVVDPWANVLAEAATAEEVLFCDVDTSIVDAVRAEFPVLADRRPIPANKTGQATGPATNPHTSRSTA